ncbi:MAG TPA: DNA alkylation repair protein [Fimbriimonadaceae bacterium]|nr:DNA alkylation repair protein [Fimbriimonadaceae bacterium]HRJ34296.1 DNA alkylation repair protein [Fimbriimonadaceae bacterium]
MTAQQILHEIEPLGSETYRRTLRNHGVQGPIFGVKIEFLKKYEKRFKKSYPLALDLFATGVYDARYLAGLIADEDRMTREDLCGWLAQDNVDTVAEYAVAWVAADGPHGWELGLEWIESPHPTTALVGWATLSGVVSVRPDDSLDIGGLRGLLRRVEKNIHSEPDRVRYKMNGFVIAVGTYVAKLTDEALATAERIGPVEVNMRGTACKVPAAPDYIRKVMGMGRVGKKRRSARC